MADEKDIPPPRIFESIIENIRILQADVSSQKAYIYPREELEKIVKIINERIKDRPVFGELQGPESNGTIDLKNVSHVITKLQLTDDGWLIGSAKILDTPCGLQVKALMELEVDHPLLSFVPRGFGNVDENGIVSNYSIVTIDLVSNRL